MENIILAIYALFLTVGVFVESQEIDSKQLRCLGKNFNSIDFHFIFLSSKIYFFFNRY